MILDGELYSIDSNGTLSRTDRKGNSEDLGASDDWEEAELVAAPDHDGAERASGVRSPRLLSHNQPWYVNAGC